MADERLIADEFRDSRGESLMLPEELSSQFDVMECLAHSNFGETLLLAEKGSGRLHVLKCRNKPEIDEGKREADALRGLRHKGLPRLVQVVETDDAIFVLRRYEDGVTLEQFVDENGPLGAELAASVAIDVCETLEFLHSQPAPIIHRDIKPSNIIINPAIGKVTLIDFGISRKYSKSAVSDTSCLGTRNFAPPEQYGFSQTDRRTDIYALGVALRFMLTCSTDEKIPDRRLERIASKCAAFSPKDRFQSASELKRALEKTLRQKAPTRSAAVAVCALIIGVATGRLSSRMDLGAMIAAAAPALYAEDLPADANSGLSGKDGGKPADESGIAADPKGAHEFLDPTVERAVRASLGKAEGEIVSLEDLERVASLYMPGDQSAGSEEEFRKLSSAIASYGELKDLEDLRLMPNLAQVFICAQPLADITPLVDCEWLTRLSLEDCHSLADLSPLEDCPRLAQINVSQCAASDFSPLAKTALVSIKLYGNPIEDVSCFAGMRLNELAIRAMPLESIADLGDVQAGELLFFNTGLTSLDGVLGQKGLIILDLVGSPGIKDFSVLDHVPSLRELRVNPSMEADMLATMQRRDLIIKVI